MKPGVYDTDAAAYYADQIGDQVTLNPTVCKALIKSSPLHAWTIHPRLNPEYREETDSKFDVGTAAHGIFLQGHDHLVHVVEANDWRTKAAQEVRDRAREEGLIPLLRKDWLKVSAMLQALREQLPLLELDGGPGMFTDGKPEQTLVWKDRGVWCRTRMDWLHDDLAYLDDLKTTKASASPLSWASRTLWGMQAEIQATMTIRGIKAVTGREPEFRFLACECKPPYAISPVRLGPSAIELANRQIDHALDEWRECLKADRWPSYPRRIIDADPPSWTLWEVEAAEEVAA